MQPKRYQRLLRLERAIGLATNAAAPDWAHIAVQSGCYDQAHLVHEFTELAGMTPTRWQRAVGGNPFHIALTADEFLQDTLIPSLASSQS